MDESASYSPNFVGVAGVGVLPLLFCEFSPPFEQDAITNKYATNETDARTLKEYFLII
jgi:hypothetical protein